MEERGFLNVERKLAAEHWWWKLPVSVLTLQAPVTIGADVTCQDAIEVMDEVGFDQLPVLDESG